jgi:hypothetical protein
MGSERIDIFHVEGVTNGGVFANSFIEAENKRLHCLGSGKDRKLG